MSEDNVFSAGISGMGPALSPKGESIVNAKIEVRDQLLDRLEERGLNVEVLAHRHRHDHDHGCECGCRCDSDCDDDVVANMGSVDEEAVVAFVRARREALDEAQVRIRLQEAQIEHLKHQVALQENKILLLREALGVSNDSE